MTKFLRFDESLIIKRLSLLPAVSKATFSLCCATRQLAAWEEYSGRFCPDVRYVAIEIVEKLCASLASNVVPIDWNVLLNEIMALLPEEVDHWAPFHVYADDAVASIAYTIRCLKDSSDQEAAWSARRAYEASDQAAIRDLDIQTGHAESESRILSHFIVQRELARQERDLQLLEIRSDSNVLATMKSYAYSEKTLETSEMLN